MTERKIYITELDMVRLEELLDAAEESSEERGRNDLETLADELDRAEVVPPQKIPPDVVTMNSKVVLKDVDSHETMTVTLVFPKDADADRGYISVLAPVGTAVLGYSRGDVVEWSVPSGLRHIMIEDVVYQPEASGDFHL